MEDDKVSNQNQSQARIKLTITIADPYHFVHVESLIDLVGSSLLYRNHRNIIYARLEETPIKITKGKLTKKKPKTIKPENAMGYYNVSMAF